MIGWEQDWAILFVWHFGQQRVYFMRLLVTPLQFGICRFLLGIGEAGNWPAALKLTGEWFPPKERSTASGIFNSGSALGAIIVPPLVAVMATNYGWQYTFIILAFLVIYGWRYFGLYIIRLVQSANETKARVVPAFKLLKNKFVSRLLTGQNFYRACMVFCNILDRPIPGRCSSLGFKNDWLVCRDTIYHGRCRKYYRWLFYPIHYKKRYAHTKSKKNCIGIIRWY